MRRAQTVPHARRVVETRLGQAIAAGGRLLDQPDGRWRVADPEGNELGQRVIARA